MKAKTVAVAPVSTVKVLSVKALRICGTNAARHVHSRVATAAPTVPAIVFGESVLGSNPLPPSVAAVT